MNQFINYNVVDMCLLVIPNGIVKVLKISKDGLPAPICRLHLLCCHVDHYTCECNMEKLRLIKFPELK